jgi:hypothetical protein
MKLKAVTHEFVDYVPDDLKEGVVYVCIQFATAVHRCCCGCGREVVTPLSPVDWTLIFNGQTISLNPSIGNWSLPCQSHYWIRQGRVVWARRWSKAEIASGRAHDQEARDDYFQRSSTAHDSGASDGSHNVAQRIHSAGSWSRFKRWLSLLAPWS